jgi:hypothetical protein
MMPLDVMRLVSSKKKPATQAQLTPGSCGKFLQSSQANRSGWTANNFPINATHAMYSTT